MHTNCCVASKVNQSHISKLSKQKNADDIHFGCKKWEKRKAKTAYA